MLSIALVVFFTLLLVTGNTMAIAVRERTGELALLSGRLLGPLRASGWCSPSRC